MTYEINVEVAPEGESLERIKSRLILITMQRQANAGEPIKEIDAMIDLRTRSMAGDEPSAEQWKLARANLADRVNLAYRADLVSDLVILLGDRLTAIPNLDAKILNAVEIEKKWTLEMGDWHGSNACGTTHCRGGSAVILHPIGRELEAVFGNWLAADVIYQKSTGRMPNFFASNEDAMADIRQSAATTAATTAT